MRISKDQISTLKAALKEKNSNAKMYLFGSRVDDDAKGGDIDILLLLHEKLSLYEIFEIKNCFWKQYGEQKLDIVQFTFSENHPFKELAMQSSIKL